MKKIEINIGLFLILSILIHVGLFVLIASKKESASLKQKKEEAVMIELATLSLDDKAKERSEQQAKPQTIDQQEIPIQQKPVEQTNRTKPKPPEQPAPTPPTIPKKQPTAQSTQEDRSDINTAQKQQSAVKPSNLETSSSRKKQQDQAQAKTNNQDPSAGQQRSQQTTINPKGATNKIKPRRIVQCLSCPKPRYPKRALRRGIEGEPRILITINSEGRVRNVQLERSSGNPEIDRAALNAGRRSRFQAIAGGARVPVSYSVVIRGSERHQQAVERKEKQGYTLPTDRENQNQPAITNAD